MTPRDPLLVRAAIRLLSAVTSRDRAAAVVGDLREELGRRATDEASPPMPGAWLLAQVLAATGAALRVATPRLFRAWRYTLRDAVRGLRAAPATTAFIVAIMALAMSAATVTFTTVDHVVLRSLPFEDDEELVVLRAHSPLGRWMAVSAVEYLSWRSSASTFEAIAAARGGLDSLQVDGVVHEIRTASVTASLFDVLRTRPLIGSVFDAGHEIDGRHLVAVISYGLWQRQLAGRADVIGQPLALRAGSFEIVGVMPPGFTYPISAVGSTDVWTPYVVPPDERDLSHGVVSYLHVVARRADGATLEASRAELYAISNALAAEYPLLSDNRRPGITPLHESLVGDVQGWMLLVLAAVGLVLAIACVNVANLLLARASRRARDAAVRSSLGATRRQLIAAFLVESVLLSAAASAIGLLVAWWGIGAVKAALPTGIARAANIALDLRVLVAAFAASVATAIVFGIVPAWQASRADVATLIKDGSLQVGSRSRWRSGLLIAEVALVVALLIGSALFVTSFIRVTGADIGIARTNLISVTVSSTRLDSEVADRLRSVAGVTDVAVVAMGSAPLIRAGFGGGTSTSVIRADDVPGAEPLQPEVRRVSPDYFATAGTAILRGRTFSADERKTSVAILDEISAHRLFGSTDVIGRRLRVGPETGYVIIGVVGNVRMSGPEADTGPQLYLPLDRGAGQFLVRTAAKPAAVVPALEAVAAELARPGRTAQVYSLDDAFRRITADRRFNAGLMLLFGVIALVIGGTGTYGVMASIVAQQSRATALRVALGASRQRIMRTVVGQAGAHLATGLVIGIGISAVASQSLTSVLFGVTPMDFRIYAIVILLLTVVGLAAAIVPARRAARVDPLAVLRQL